MDPRAVLAVVERALSLQCAVAVAQVLISSAHGARSLLVACLRHLVYFGTAFLPSHQHPSFRSVVRRASRSWVVWPLQLACLPSGALLVPL